MKANFTISPANSSRSHEILFLRMHGYIFSLWKRLFSDIKLGITSSLPPRKGHFQQSSTLQNPKFLPSGPTMVGPRGHTILITQFFHIAPSMSTTFRRACLRVYFYDVGCLIWLRGIFLRCWMLDVA